MPKGSVWHRWYVVGPILALLGCVNLVAAELVSAPGQYRGYSRQAYTQWTRESRLVAARDGTALALDIFLPAARSGAQIKELPCIWTQHPYLRASFGDNGRARTQLDKDPWLRVLLRNGYAVVVADLRGCGTSAGTWDGPFGVVESQDAYDITEWIAAQPWSNGKVGMFGTSYSGITQYLAAATKPPHLVAIMPEMACVDLYSFVYQGGIYQEDFLSKWSQEVRSLESANISLRVDADRDTGLLHTRARKDHSLNRYADDFVRPLHFRDSRDNVSGEQPFLVRSPVAHLKNISESGIAIYHVTGWNDMWVKDALLTFKNLTSRQKLIIGPWSHIGREGFDLTAERLRWYDHFLRSVDNGIDKEPGIYYYTLNAPPERQWHWAREWPLANETRQNYLLLGGNSRASKPSSGGGRLMAGASQPPQASERYRVDPTTTTGSASRWANGYGVPLEYPDLRENDVKGLHYTTDPLTEELEVTGHPIVRLFVSAADSTKDVDLYAYLEEVDARGSSRYITEGKLRASHRSTTEATHDTLGTPYHRSYKQDIVELTSDPVEIAFDLLPTSFLFHAGSRIRLTITCADADNYEKISADPLPCIDVWYGQGRASRLELPVIKGNGTSHATPIGLER
jgi:uncharacterized protein